MSIIDVCRKDARERKARTVLRFAPKTSHQSNGFVEAVHGHIQGLARCDQSQIETNTGTTFSAKSPQYLLGTPFVSPLRMFGESVFALIPDHEVRAAKLTNRWISGCWWRQDASSDEHLVETKFGLVKCRSARRKPPEKQWSRREKVDARATEWNFDVEMDTGIIGPPRESHRDVGTATATATATAPDLSHKLTIMNPRCVDTECTQKHSGSELSDQISAELLDGQHAGLPVR